ncbi:large-conductance mechanosensitive channel protein MscL [Compostibacter hankyongensis]|uniref:Large-conductance mechanosensitive channel n=1 Tax=Compostibacter hankyongensis TaxID=1007089 RepID=A0ABP8FI46_9BACT
MSLLKEFKEFAMKGNVVDLAVAVVIGAAFGKIVTSLVNDIIMPLVGLLTGGMNFSDKKVILSQAVTDAAGKVIKPENAITYGVFIQSVIDFLIVAFAIFMAIKAMNSLKRKKEEAPAAPPAPTATEALLTEIRDLLRK